MKNSGNMTMVRNVIVFAMLSVLLAGCSEPRMSKQELRTAVGIVDGQSNDIRIGGVLYRIPSQYRIKVVDIDEAKVKARSYDDAVSRVIFHMNLSSWFDPPPVNLGEGNALVRIEISKHGFEDPVRRVREFEEKKWANQRDIPEWGLREYISVDFPEHGGWGILSYRAFSATTPRGGPVLYACDTDFNASKENVAKAVTCKSGYQTLRGPTIKNVFSGLLLPRWKEVNTEILELVDSLIVEE